MSRRSARSAAPFALSMSLPLKRTEPEIAILKPDDHPAEGRFPAAGFADNAERASFADVERDTVDGVNNVAARGTCSAYAPGNV